MKIKALRLKLGLMLALILLNATSSYATAYNNETYALPPNKAYLDKCQKKVMELHRGHIGRETVLHENYQFYMQYEVFARDGSHWFTTCNLDTGIIVSNQKIDGTIPYNDNDIR